MACLCFFLLPLAGCSNPASAAAAPPPPGEVRLWQDGAIFNLVGDLIANAHARVMVEMYELGRDEIVTALGAAKRRNASVRVITDPTVNASRQSAVQLDRLGVAERAYPDDDGRFQIDHVKLLIVDGTAAIGGMNWGRHSEHNHDYVLETTVATDVARLTAVFEQDWALAGGHPQPLPASDLAVAQTAPTSDIRTMLEHALDHASQKILAEVYTLTDPAIIARIAMAHRRGVDVRVILDPNQDYNRHAYELLRAATVDVRWYPVPRGVLLHAKIGLVDGELILGSANWTVSGLGVNHELDIETRDPQAIAAYGSRFQTDWRNAYA